MCEEGGIFHGRTAWFSATVPAQVKSLWMTNAGLERGPRVAQYLFSDDPNAKDTIGFYRSKKWQLDSQLPLTIFTSQWIQDAVMNGALCDIAFAHYILGEPSEEAYGCKKALDGIAEDEIWNFVDETNIGIRSTKEFRQCRNAIKNLGRQSDPQTTEKSQKCQKSKGVKNSTSNKQHRMYDGFIHIDDIKLNPDLKLEDFIPNSNGCEVRLIKGTDHY